MKTSTVVFFVLLALVLFPAITNAQPGFGDDVDDVPIDGGLSLLLTAGAGYGIKKLKHPKKNKY